MIKKLSVLIVWRRQERGSGKALYLLPTNRRWGRNGVGFATGHVPRAKKLPAHPRGDGVWHLQVVYRAHGYSIKAESAIEKDKSTDTNEIATEGAFSFCPSKVVI